MNNKTEVVDKLERFLIDNKSIKLETMKEIYPFLKEIKEQLSIHVVSNWAVLKTITYERTICNYRPSEYGFYEG